MRRNANVAIFTYYCPGAQNSRLFKSFPKDLLHSLSSENITSNFHSWSMSLQVALRLHFDTITLKLVKWTYNLWHLKCALRRQNFTRNAKLKRFYKVLTTNTDGRKEFISTMEGKDAWWNLVTGRYSWHGWPTCKCIWRIKIIHIHLHVLGIFFFLGLKKFVCAFQTCVWKSEDALGHIYEDIHRNF